MRFDLSISEASELIPELEIMSKFPSSGQKVVFKGKQQNGDLVVVKFFDVNTTLDRATREIDAMLRLDSPYIAKVIDFRTTRKDHTFHYVIEEYIEGKTIKDVLLSGEIFPSRSIISFLYKMCDALDKVWKNDLVHRDIKPLNIIIRPNGDPVLLDFGLVRNLNKESITDTAVEIGPGTYPYAAPEQFRNQKDIISCRTDLYSLGITVFEMATGFHPLWDDSDTFQNNIERMITGDIPDIRQFIPDYDEDLAMVIFKLTRNPSHRRFKDPEQLKKLLERLWEVGA